MDLAKTRLSGFKMYSKVRLTRHVCVHLTQIMGTSLPCKSGSPHADEIDKMAR